jgi:hypothetical protein
MSKSKALIFMLLCGSTVASAQTGTVFRGFVKSDTKIYDGSELLRRGTEIECTINPKNDQCCFEDEPGTVCLPLSELSRKKVPKRDVAIHSVTYNDSASADKDACKHGTDYREGSDEFKWSYGVRLKNNTDGRAMIYVTHIARRGPMRLPLPAMTKMWSGPIDNKCHAFTFTKSDIREFLNTYRRAFEPYLDPATDLNLGVEVVVQVFAEFPEDNYKNNEIRMNTSLPADSDGEWPPAEILKYATPPAR